MSTIIIKNNSAEDIFIEDLGVKIGSTSEKILSNYFTVVDISNSKNLKLYVSNRELVVNNGIEDLHPINGWKHINLETEYEDAYSEDIPFDDTTTEETLGYTVQLVDITGGTSINNVTPVAIPFNSEIYKSYPYFTHSNVTNNSRLTVEVRGNYKISYAINWYVNSSGDVNIRTRIRKNGDTYIPSSSYGYAINPDHVQGTNVSTVFVYLEAGDYIEIMSDRVGDTTEALTEAGASHLYMEIV